MKAIVQSEYGSADVLRLEELVSLPANSSLRCKFNIRCKYVKMIIATPAKAGIVRLLHEESGVER